MRTVFLSHLSCSSSMLCAHILYSNILALYSHTQREKRDNAVAIAAANKAAEKKEKDAAKKARKEKAKAEAEQRKKDEEVSILW